MIRCLPKGLCSWDFLLDGEGHQASVDFNWLGEQGVITADNVPLDVCKQGLLSGHWTLDRAGQSVVSAQKTSPFTRTFEIQHAHESLVLSAESAFGRSFRIERSGSMVATIQPDHAFTRRASIEILAQDWDFPTIAFAFWLVVLTWRRAASNNSASTAGT